MRRQKSSPAELYSRAHFPEKPTPKTLEFVQTSGLHKERADWRLREREDAYGSLFAKLFPKDKGNVALTKILSEQAVKLDMLLREFVKRGKAATIEEAFHMLERENPDVLKPASKERISKEESVRGEVLKVGFAIANKKWEKAAAQIQQSEKKLVKKGEGDQIKIFHEELTPILRETLSSLIDRKDSEGVRELSSAVFWLFNIAGLKGLSLGDLPDRAAKSHEHMDGIKNRLMSEVKIPYMFVATRVGWKNFGVSITSIEQNPAVVGAARKHLFDRFGGGANPILYHSTREGLLKNGILTEAEIEKQRKSEIAPRAQKYLLDRFGRGEYDAILYKSSREEFIHYGVLTKVEIEQHRRTEILPRARKYLIERLGNGRYPTLFTSARNEYVSNGILTPEEAQSINRLPEVQKYLQKGI